MKRLLVALVVLAAAGCPQQPCKKGTLFVSYTLTNGAEAAQTIDVTLQLDGGSTQTMTASRQSHGSSGSIEVDFASYPAGHELTLILTARTGDQELATQTQTSTASPTCTALSFALDGAPANPDLSTGSTDDLAPSMPDLWTPDLFGETICILDTDTFDDGCVYSP